MNLTYQDCKKLKDAGFPQDCQFYWCDFNVDGGPGIEYRGAIPGDIENVILCGAPTLSELVEAFDWFESLTAPKITCEGDESGVTCGWIAKAAILPENEWKIIEDLGVTPEQAVKNLWLALNKKS